MKILQNSMKRSYVLNQMKGNNERKEKSLAFYNYLVLEYDCLLFLPLNHLITELPISGHIIISTWQYLTSVLSLWCIIYKLEV